MRANTGRDWGRVCVALAALVVCGTVSAASSALKFSDSHKETVKKFRVVSAAKVATVFSVVKATSAFSITAALDLSAAPPTAFTADTAITFGLGGYFFSAGGVTTNGNWLGMAASAHWASFDPEKPKKIAEFEHRVHVWYQLDESQTPVVNDVAASGYGIWDDAGKKFVQHFSQTIAKLTFTYDEKKKTLGIKVIGNLGTFRKFTGANDGYDGYAGETDKYIVAHDPAGKPSYATSSYNWFDTRNPYLYGSPAARIMPAAAHLDGSVTDTAMRGPTGEGEYSKYLTTASAISYTTPAGESDFYVDIFQKDGNKTSVSGTLSFAGKAPKIEAAKGVTVDGVAQHTHNASIKGTGSVSKVEATVPPAN